LEIQQKNKGLYIDGAVVDNSNLSTELKKLRIELHRTIKLVTHDIEERMQYNTAIARMMELTNAMYAVADSELSSTEGKKVFSEIVDKFLPILNPFVPHFAEELWSIFGKKTLLADEKWPEYIEELTIRDEIEIVFQINGKIKSKANVSSDITEEEMKKLAHLDAKMAEILSGKQIIKEIVVPGKLVNIVVK
jgi:leucyl-tRNA synthetase